MGILVGTEHQVVEKSVKKVKSILTSYLQKLYKREGDYPLVEVENPAMKIIEMSVRPSMHHGNTSFPLKSSITVSTPLVFGEEEDGVYDCYLSFCLMLTFIVMTFASWTPWPGIS